MSAEVELLRRAAALMRERAQAATPGPWEALEGGDRLVAWRTTPEGFDDDFEYVVDEPIENAENAEHIASWHPAVALAVADWLDHCAKVTENKDVNFALRVAINSNALIVARAYLGEVSDAS